MYIFCLFVLYVNFVSPIYMYIAKSFETHFNLQNVIPFSQLVSFAFYSFVVNFDLIIFYVFGYFLFISIET